jgi:putative membrane protein
MLWLKAFHVMAVITWLAGLFYLPRLFVSHADAPKGSELSETFKTMERRLLRGIMNPAMVAVWITGPWLAWWEGVYEDGWFIAKVTLVVLMTWYHHMLGYWRKDFLADRNTRSPGFYRVANEVPTVLMVLIVILVIVKPL